MADPKTYRIPFDEDGDRQQRDMKMGMGVWWKCFEKYSYTRKEIAEAEQPNTTFRDPRIVFTPPEFEMLRLGGLGVVGGTVAWGCTSLAVLKYFQRQVVRKGFRPVGRFAQGSWMTVQILSGAAMSLSMCGMYMKEYGSPLVVEQRHCPAYRKFEPCSENEQCMELCKIGSHKHFLDGYFECRRLAGEGGDSGDFNSFPKGI